MDTINLVENEKLEIIRPVVMQEKMKNSEKDSGKMEAVESCSDVGISDSYLYMADVDIVIDRVRSVTLRAPLSIEGLDISAVVDTGAEVTVMSETLFSSIPESKRPPLKPTKRNLVVAAAGKRMSTLGVAEVSVVLGPLEFLWSIYVAPIGDDLLLGCDIIDEKDVTTKVV